MSVGIVTNLFRCTLRLWLQCAKPSSIHIWKWEYFCVVELWHCCHRAQTIHVCIIYTHLTCTISFLCVFTTVKCDKNLIQFFVFYFAVSFYIFCLLTTIIRLCFGGVLVEILTLLFKLFFFFIYSVEGFYFVMLDTSLIVRCWWLSRCVCRFRKFLEFLQLPER